MTRYFFQPRYFECKQADIEQIKYKVSKKMFVLKTPAQEERGGGGFVYLVFIYT